MQYQHYHDEVLSELANIGNPDLASKIGADRHSSLTYSGVRVPTRRQLVAGGFTFYHLNESQILNIWDDLWTHATNGDVMFCALDYYRERVRKHPAIEYWPVIRNWVAKVENWAHSDDLSSIYSWLLEANFQEIYPQLQLWNVCNDLWKKRVSIVSLIHYSGKNAVFLEPELVLPLVQNCIADHRQYMQKATGWVLREMHRKYPQDISRFLTQNLAGIGSVALSRAIAHLPTRERSRMRNSWRQQVANRNR